METWTAGLRQRPIYRVAAGALAVALFAGAAPTAGASSTAGADTTPVTTAEVEFDTTAELRVAALTAFSNWDPHNNPTGGAEPFYWPAVYDRLIQLTPAPEYKYTPMLATSWEFSSDLLTLTLELRDDVTFHDGSAFNAEVVKANLEHGVPQLGSRSQLTTFTSAEVVDEYTIRINMSAPDGTVLDKLAGFAGMMVSPKGLASGTLATVPAGSGPYLPILDQQTQTEVVYEPNPNYWDPTVPKLARVVVTAFPDEITRLNAFNAGEIDIAAFTAISYPDLGDLSDVNVYPIESLATYLAAVNPAKDAAFTPDVLSALSVAIDRTAISEQLLFGQCTPTIQVFGPGQVGYIDGVDSEIYDPEAARALLETVGVQGLQIEILYSTLEPYVSLASILQAEWGELGIDVSVTPIPAQESSAAWLDGTGDVFVSLLVGGPSSAARLDQYRSRNVGVLPPSVEDAWARAQSFSPESAEATAEYETIGREFIESPISIPICNPKTFVAANSNLVGADAMGWSGLITGFDWTRLGVAQG